MAAVQGIELMREFKSSPLVEKELAHIRQKVTFLECDRCLAPDIETMRQWALIADLPKALLSILPSQSWQSSSTGEIAMSALEEGLV